ncbi:hypothetical protein DFH09DRAFT_1455549 [Mycena vulgaris]|nr:hypothetical protein DFH09DRAFT_1455549 [Mycena vulgaris]
MDFTVTDGVHLQDSHLAILRTNDHAARNGNGGGGQLWDQLFSATLDVRPSLPSHHIYIYIHDPRPSPPLAKNLLPHPRRSDSLPGPRVSAIPAARQIAVSSSLDSDTYLRKPMYDTSATPRTAFSCLAPAHFDAGGRYYGSAREAAPEPSFAPTLPRPTPPSPWHTSSQPPPSPPLPASLSSRLSTAPFPPPLPTSLYHAPARNADRPQTARIALPALARRPLAKRGAWGGMRARGGLFLVLEVRRWTAAVDEAHLADESPPALAVAASYWSAVAPAPRVSASDRARFRGTWTVVKACVMDDARRRMRMGLRSAMECTARAGALWTTVAEARFVDAQRDRWGGGRVAPVTRGRESQPHRRRTRLASSSCLCERRWRVYRAGGWRAGSQADARRCRVQTRVAFLRRRCAVCVVDALRPPAAGGERAPQV